MLELLLEPSFLEQVFEHFLCFCSVAMLSLLKPFVLLSVFGAILCLLEFAAFVF